MPHKGRGERRGKGGGGGKKPVNHVRLICISIEGEKKREPGIIRKKKEGKKGGKGGRKGRLVRHGVCLRNYQLTFRSG